jgi:hypothetical protein
VKVRPSEAGHRIVAEAVEAQAEAIVMAMPQNRPPGKLLNRTLEVVLAKRPCRVVIDSQRAQPFEHVSASSQTTALDGNEREHVGARLGGREENH